MIKNIFLISLWIFLSTVFATAQIKKVIIEVEGLDIASWAAKLEDTLEKVNGVAKVRMFPAEDKVEVEVAHSVKVDLEKIASAVEDAAYFLQYWGLEATGYVVNWEGEPALFIPENQVKLLLGANSKETEEKLQKLMGKHGEQSKVSVRGTLQKVSHPDHAGPILKL
ncbi:heavy-metal-associated domain-containing protein, partial [Acidobacteria bacterium AH-259-A15]|nr:heavy-metal-associated domain-containing protein [Acidobacteria bacterium AH-259-A15]